MSYTPDPTKKDPHKQRVKFREESASYDPTAAIYPKMKRRKGHPTTEQTRINHWPETELKPPKPGKKRQKRSFSGAVYRMCESLKTVRIRIPHPNWQMRLNPRTEMEWRVSVMPWSRSQYIDIRRYSGGNVTPNGILLHYDVMKAVLPHLIDLMAELERAETREPGQIRPVQIFVV